MSRARPTLALLAIAAGCARAEAVGRVTDASGAPLAGARVSVVGAPCHTTTDASGGFTLACAPGRWQMVVSERGYLSAQIEVDAREPGTHPVGTRTLVDVPRGEGLFARQAASWTRIPPAWAQRTLEGDRTDPTSARFCLEPEVSVPFVAQAGVVEVFSVRAPDWRAWRLDTDGCAWRLERQGPRWRTTWADQPRSHTQALGDDHAWVFLTLEPGDYFLSRWAGSFVADPSAGADRYGGWWLQVR